MALSKFAGDDLLLLTVFSHARLPREQRHRGAMSSIVLNRGCSRPDAVSGVRSLGQSAAAGRADSFCIRTKAAPALF